jgi:hypothetical protein
VRPQCRFGDGPATVRVELEHGCVCYPDDREQSLCEHHWYKMEPLGDATVVEEYILSDMEYTRRKSVAAGHCRPDHPVFNEEDWT